VVDLRRPVMPPPVSYISRIHMRSSMFIGLDLWVNPATRGPPVSSISSIHTGSSVFVGLDLLQQRFVGPVRTLAVDLLTRGKRLTEQGAVIDAETSLDNMLSDLMGGVAGSAAGVRYT